MKKYFSVFSSMGTLKIINLCFFLIYFCTPHFLFSGYFGVFFLILVLLCTTGNFLNIVAAFRLFGFLWQNVKSTFFLEFLLMLFLRRLFLLLLNSKPPLQEVKFRGRPEFGTT